MAQRASRTNFSSKGFTIVELLIVVVVIAILATITVVAYNGISQQAKTSVVSLAVNTWEKAIAMERATTDALPINNNASYCLGSAATDFPATDGFEAGSCYQQSMWLESNPSEVTTGNYSYEQEFFASWPSTVPRSNGLLPVTTTSVAIPSGGDVLHITSRARGIVATRGQAAPGGTLFLATGVTIGPNVIYTALQWTPQTEGDCMTGGSSNAMWVSVGGQTGGALSGDSCLLIYQ